MPDCPHHDHRRADESLRWIEAENNPWLVRVLDVRPVTLGSRSAVKSAEHADNAFALGQEDGIGFVGQMPEVDRTIDASLRFRVAPILAEGVLFTPRVMEHKWACYFYDHRIIVVRSWLRRVMLVAETVSEPDWLEIVSIRGHFFAADEEPGYTLATMNYFLRSHAMNQSYPVPLPENIGADPRGAASFCFSLFGSRAEFATPDHVPIVPSASPLRSDSLLHIALARHDGNAAVRQLDAGVPVDLLSREGLSTLQWAVAHDDPAMMQLLLDRGCPVDVRSADGATTLMAAAQTGRVDAARFLLDRGAEVNAADQHGYTALHRAAEAGQREMVRLLLDRGADPARAAEGHTPRSLAELLGDQELIALLD